MSMELVLVCVCVCVCVCAYVESVQRGVESAGSLPRERVMRYIRAPARIYQGMVLHTCLPLLRTLTFASFGSPIIRRASLDFAMNPNRVFSFPLAKGVLCVCETQKHQQRQTRRKPTGKCPWDMAHSERIDLLRGTLRATNSPHSPFDWHIPRPGSVLERSV
jgi:hypothetical protein